MKKIYSLLFIIIALAAWNFISIDIKANSSEPIAISSGPSITYAADPQFLTKMLNGTNINVSTGKLSNEWFFSLYSFSRGLLNICLFLFLIYVAFRNILNLNIETYAIKKIIPKLIFAAFLGNLLLPIATIMSSILDALQSAVPIFHPPGSWDWIGLVSKGLVTTTGSTLLGFLTMWLSLAISSLLVIVPIAMNIILIGGLLLLGLFHSLRPWIVLLAVAFGPVAVGLSALPETEGVFKKWWKILIFWIYYPLLLAVIYYLAKLIPSMSGAVGDGFLSSLIGLVIPTVLKIALFAVAVRAPFTWEKDVSGVIAALPGQVSGAYKKGAGIAETVGKKSTRLAYDWQTNLRDRDMSNKMAKAKSSGDFARTATNNLNTEGGRADLRTQYIAQTKDRLAQDPDALRRIYGVENINEVDDEAIGNTMDEYVAGNYTHDTSVRGMATQDFFDSNIANIEERSRSSVLANYEKKAEKDFADKTMKAIKKKPLYRALELEQSHGLLSFGMGAWAQAAVAQRLTQETSDKEDIKSVKRKGVVFRKTSSRMARGKSERERVADDYSKAEKLDDLLQYSDIIEKIVSAAKASITDPNLTDAERERQAVQWYQATAHKQMIDGANIVGWDNAFDPIKNQFESNDQFEDHMNKISELYPRMVALAAREARANKDPELQHALTRDQLTRATYTAIGSENPPPVTGGPRPGRGPARPPGASGPTGPGYTPPTGPYPGGAPSGGFGGGDEEAIEALQDVASNISQVSQELKEVNNSVNGVRNQIKTTTGLPLQRMANLTSKMNTNAITGEDIEQLSTETEMGLSDVGNILLRKSPGKEPEVRQFVQDLDASKGLSVPEMLERAKVEFYPNEPIDPRLEEQIVNISSNQVVSMAALKGNDQNKAISTLAGQFVVNQNISPKLISQLDQSIQVFNRAEANPSSVSPEALEGAKQFIASNVAGLPDGSMIDRTTVENISRVISASIVRDPLRDVPPTNS